MVPADSKSNFSVFAMVAGTALLLSTPFIFAVSGVHGDDAYIFFRYANNLAEGRGLAFNPGEPSVGVTSILWTLVLALLKLIFGAAALPFTAKVLGVVLYAISASLWALIVAESTQRPWIGIASGLLIAGNPLGVILAVSGMDTSLSILLLSAVLFCFHRHRFQRPLFLGLLLGLFFLTRPDAVVLWLVMAVVFTVGILNQYRRTSSASDLLKHANTGLLILGGAMLMAIPWMVVVYHYSGQLIPPTQIGKMLERLPDEDSITYAQFLALDLVSRLGLAGKYMIAVFNIERGGVTVLPFYFALILGMPSVMLFQNSCRILSADHDLLLALWLYAVLLLLTFSLLFPLPWPRYIATIIPVSIAGSLLLIHRLLLPWLEGRMTQPWAPAFGRRFSAYLWIAFGLSILAPLAITYPLHVDNANSQQVRRAVGEWIRDNTPPDAVVALEPIGEIGFYSERRVVDLGGLISPAVWEYIGNGYSDADRMFEFLKKNHAQYLVDRPQEIPWSLNNTVQKFEGSFVWHTTFGAGINAHLIYKLLSG